MSCISTMKLPLIDLSKLDGSKPGTDRWESLQCQVRQALEEFGCFEALDPKMTLELHNEVFQQAEELFKLPIDVKRQFVVPNKPFDGYRTNLPLSPHYESFGMGYSPNSDSIEKLAEVMWPEGNTRFCETMNTYVMRVLTLDALLKKLALGSLGLDKYVDSLAKSVRYSFRMMRYAAPGTEEPEDPGTGCHRDANFMTILQQNHVNGLEVQTKDGRWIRVAPSSASSFIVIAGESFYRGWSNGRLRSPCHRVNTRGHEPRYSIGLFSSDQGMLQCPEELVDDQHPLLFKPFDMAGLTRIYKTPEGLNGASPMDTYFKV